MKFGSSNITSVKLGSTNVDAIYVGSTKIYPTSSPYVVPTAVTSGLMMYLDPSVGDLTDQSGNGRDATLFNAPTITAGVGGTGGAGYVQLNGTNQYFSSPSLYNAGNTAHTIEIWVRAAAANQNLYSDASSQNYNTNYHASGAQIYAGPVTNNTVISALWTGTATARVVNGSNTSWLNNWRQIVRTYSGTTLTPYTNGLAGTAGTITWDPPWAGVNPDVWYQNYGPTESTTYSGTTAGWYSGRYGIVRVYNRALSAAEVLSNYNNTKSVYGL